jgi:hypothetical protein
MNLRSTAWPCLALGLLALWLLALWLPPPGPQARAAWVTSGGRTSGKICCRGARQTVRGRGPGFRPQAPPLLENRGLAPAAFAGDAMGDLQSTEMALAFVGVAGFFATWFLLDKRARDSGARGRGLTVERLFASPDEYIVYERDATGSVTLSHGGKSSLWMGSWNPDNPLEYGLEYFRTQVAVSLATGPHRRMLMLGLGIGAIPATLLAVCPELTVDVVEIDQGVIDGVRQFTNMREDDRLRLHLADASEFVTRPECQGHYDIVILDCFEPSGVPPVFHARTFYENALRCLRPGGVFSMNLIWTLKEAPRIKAHLRECLHSPSAIFGRTESNCAIFGTATAPPLDPDALLQHPPSPTFVPVKLSWREFHNRLE